MRRAGASLLALSFLLTATTIISARPHPAQLNTATLRSLSQTGLEKQPVSNLMSADSTRPAIVARDVARTTSLCVTDCQTMLSTVIGMLEHEPTLAGKKLLLEQTLRKHPQFHTLRLQLPGSGLLTFGQKPNADTLQRLQAVEQSAQSQNKLITGELNSLNTQSGSNLHLALAAPVNVVNKAGIQTGSGILSADTSMDVLARVATHLDRQFGTATTLSCKTSTLTLGEPIQISAQGGTPHSASVSHDTTVPGWQVKSHVRVSDGVSLHQQPNAAPGTTEIVVRFAVKPSEADLKKMAADSGSRIVLRRDISRLYVFQADGDRLADLTSFFYSQGALSIEPHTKYSVHEDTSNEPNDVLYPKYQWNFPMINVNQEWSTTTGNPTVTIAVIDTGVDQNHPEFSGQLAAGYNVLNPEQFPADDNGHGSHVAGVIAAKTNNVEGVAGIAYSSRIMPIKAMDKDGSGSVADIATGIEWAVDHGASVINLSLGNDENSDILHNAVKYATDHNVAVVAAMGNDSTNTPNYPAAFPEAVSVCAVDQQGQRASFSNYGPHAFISAPGVSIASTYPDNRYAAMSGTSMATPHVTAIIGLLKSINPQLTVNGVKDILQSTATDLGDPGRDDYYGYGLINAQSAAAKAAGS